jgi:exodeoxyribonuclease V gamma subunit
MNPAYAPTAPAAPVPLAPGLVTLHGNRLELLGEAVFAWLAKHPLGALEEEVLLVQSHGVAEWLKTALAAQGGVCAATRIELPGRFLWRAYRAVLGRDAVPARSPLDRQPLVWRLMAWLPDAAERPGFEALAAFLRVGGVERRLQLAMRLADLYDQYQVYRADWLDGWADGHDVLPSAPGTRPSAAPPMAAEQRWQAALWRELVGALAPHERAATRPGLQRRFLAAFDEPEAPVATIDRSDGAPQRRLAAPLPRRIVLFGMTHLPTQVLDALAAVALRSQVLVAVPNPCRYHWADAIDGRELLTTGRRRQPLREGRDLAAVALADMHAHAHPLLAAWGRQGRDFVRQLDAFDDRVASRGSAAAARVDLFDAGPGATLLGQVQARIRDLVPLAEHAALGASPIAATDRSIVFHIAHSPQREVEILHDQLLEMLAEPPGAGRLAPRDIVVMVPDIAVYAPAIRAVFGQLPAHDPRSIPYAVVDLAERSSNPLLVAFDWLMRAPAQRVRASEIGDLFDVPGIARRFGLGAADVAVVARWIESAGIRWGIDATHRAGLGFAASGAGNTWRAGLDRLLLGYASGASPDAAFHGIEPHGEIGGLEAALAGPLIDLVDAVDAWLHIAAADAAPAVWAARCRVLVDAFASSADERERATVSALHAALDDWLDGCALADFDAPLPLPVVREAWLGGVDEPAAGRRFRGGGVTFCTLLPMRSIPFEVVCLLGMNDGDYPRATVHSDFDLMALPGHQRAGDRSRRDDDRQLVLEALLSARRVFYVGWVGRSVRDHSRQPPSVLVAQLRDYLAAGWSPEVLETRTTEHPLQPFSRRYFERHAGDPAAGQPPLFTYAREWRAAHAEDAASKPPPRSVPGGRVAAAGAMPSPSASREPRPAPLDAAALARFLKNPVRSYFRERLGVVFPDPRRDPIVHDDEPFVLAGLDLHGRISAAAAESVGRLLQDAKAPRDITPADLRGAVGAAVARLRRAGELPLAGPGGRAGTELTAALLPMLGAWCAELARWPRLLPPLALHLDHAGVGIDETIDGLRAAPAGDAAADAGPPRPVWLEWTASRLSVAKRRGSPRVQPAKLIGAWVRMLVASAAGIGVRSVLVGSDARVELAALDAAEATDALRALLVAWQQGTLEPLPVAAKTGLALVSGAADAGAIYDGAGNPGAGAGEVADAALARVWPDFEALARDGRLGPLAEALYGPLARWADGSSVLSMHAGVDPDEIDGEGEGEGEGDGIG